MFDEYALLTLLNLLTIEEARFRLYLTGVFDHFPAKKEVRYLTIFSAKKRVMYIFDHSVC